MKEMYVFYEHHKDANGAVLATDLLWSSYRTGMGIFWNKDRALHEFIIKIAKLPNLAERSFDDKTKIWSYIGEAGHTIISRMETALKGVGIISKFDFIHVDNLAEQIASGGITEPDTQKKFNSEDFYYNKNTPAQSMTLTRGQILVKLATLLGTEPLAFQALEKSDTEAGKRLYRKAAMKYHPDRNGGDGSKMSELNMYWRMYNG